MKIGAIVPNAGPIPRLLGVAEMARAAEQAGAASLWVSDHLVLSGEARADYPYSKDGTITWDAEGDYFEALSICSYIAGITTEFEIGTAVLILPQRNVIQTAKEASTIDTLSEGRLVLGVGTGWNRLEMEALGYDFATRGRRMDEMIEVLRECWTGQPTAFDGRHVQVPANLLLFPRPIRPAGPPIVVGGMTPPAVRRAARIGDGWLALMFVDQWEGDMLAAMAGLMRAESEAAGREITPRWVLKLHCSPESVGEIPGRIEEAARLGFDEVIIEAPFATGIDPACNLISTTVASWS